LKNGTKRLSASVSRHLRLLIPFLTLGLALLVSPLFAVSPVDAATLLAPATSLQVESSCAQPPANVDPLSLSDAQLALYGWPSREVISENPTAWKQNLSKAHLRICGTSPDGKGITHKLYRKPGESTKNSDNWSGGEAYGSRGTFRDSSVSFDVPSISGSVGDHVSMWAGVGGDPAYDGGSGGLIQAGVDSSITSSGVYNESWWEMLTPGYSNSEQNLPLCRLRTGDEVYVYVESNYNGSGYNYFYIENDSAACYNSYYDYSGDFSDSATGECILERPTVGGGFTGLANFGVTYLYDCMEGSNSAYLGILSWSNNTLDMWDGSHDLVQVYSDSNAGGDGYQLFWEYRT
jgi:hypothetical protein